MLRKLMAVLLPALFMINACQAEDGAAFSEGQHYKIAKPSGKTAKPEVIEFFSYGCPHCYHAEPAVNAFHSKEKDISFKRVAVVGFNSNFDLLAKAFYAAEALGIGAKIHEPLFKQVHEAHTMPMNDQDVARFLSGFGVSETQALGTLNSFAVSSQMNQAKQLQQDFRIRGVPAFIVNDKYFTDVGMAGSLEALPEVLNFLARK